MTSSDPIVLKIHTYILKHDPDLVGSLSFPSTMELIRIGKSGSILRLCPLCPRWDALRSEIEFIVAQETHLRKFQNGSDERSAHSTYEFILDGDTCAYRVNHTNGDCETVYWSSGKRVDTIAQCDLTDEQVKGTRVTEFLELCSILSEKWTFVYRKLVDAHRIDNVHALFWEESGKDGNYTTCILRSFAPFTNKIMLSGPGLEDVSGSTYEGANDTITEAYNNTYPNIRCHIESPTGWDSTITRPGKREERILLAEGYVSPENKDATDISLALLITIGTFLVLFSGVCWYKKRDIIDAIMEIHDWWWDKKRRRYVRVS